MQCFVEFCVDDHDAGRTYLARDYARLPLLLQIGSYHVSGYRVGDLTAYDGR